MGLHKKTSTKPTGLEQGRKAAFILSNAACVCVCVGENRSHFPAEETLVYILAREAGEKSWLKNEEGKQKWRCVCSSVELFSRTKHTGIPKVCIRLTSARVSAHMLLLSL